MGLNRNARFADGHGHIDVDVAADFKDDTGLQVGLKACSGDSEVISADRETGEDINTGLVALGDVLDLG